MHSLIFETSMWLLAGSTRLHLHTCCFHFSGTSAQRLQREVLNAADSCWVCTLGIPQLEVSASFDYQAFKVLSCVLIYVQLWSIWACRTLRAGYFFSRGESRENPWTDANPHGWLYSVGNSVSPSALHHACSGTRLLAQAHWLKTRLFVRAKILSPSDAFWSCLQLWAWLYALYALCLSSYCGALLIGS